MAQPVEQLPLILEDVSSNPTRDRIFPHGCIHLGMCGRCRVILSQFLVRGQLQYRTAFDYDNISKGETYIAGYYEELDEVMSSDEDEAESTSKPSAYGYTIPNVQLVSESLLTTSFKLAYAQNVFISTNFRHFCYFR